MISHANHRRSFIKIVTILCPDESGDNNVHNNGNTFQWSGVYHWNRCSDDEAIAVFWAVFLPGYSLCHKLRLHLDEVMIDTIKRLVWVSRSISTRSCVVHLVARTECLTPSVADGNSSVAYGHLWWVEAWMVWPPTYPQSYMSAFRFVIPHAVPVISRRQTTHDDTTAVINLLEAGCSLPSISLRTSIHFVLSTVSPCFVLSTVIMYFRD